ncbi:MAG: sulfatase-like hydrolase/transferase [Paludibacteraceae bacterium]|nr:sulfatase-like hydrolase/transferase [Paludibacteraceae bacterium]
MIDYKSLLERLRTSQWTIFVAMVVALTLKSTFWHAQLFMDWDIRLHHIIYSSLWLSIGVLACRKRPWWSLVIFLIVSAWMFSCFVYYKVWGVMVTMDEVRNLGNLKGFESSIFADWKWDMLLWLALPDALYIALLCWMRPAKKSRWLHAVAVLVITILLFPLHQWSYHKIKLPELQSYNPYEPGLKHFWFDHQILIDPTFKFYWDAKMTFLSQTATYWEIPYAHQYGIVDYGFSMMLFDHYYRGFEAEVVDEPVVMSEEEEQLVSELYNPDNEEFTPERSLVLILVESFESWVIDAKGKDGTWVMPNLHRFMEENNTFYAPNLQSMIKRGGSSDGQLMVVTGLAPVDLGVAVTMFGDQPFPNYAHFYPNSRTLNPSPGVWRQPVMNPNYGIKELEESDSIMGSDPGLFHRMNSVDLDSVSFTLLITVSTHVPFENADNVAYEIDPAVPEKLARYMKCFHYLDEHLGTFINRMKDSPELRNCDIVITADHSILFDKEIEELNGYAQQSGMMAADKRTGQVPLIMYSPTLTESKRCDEQCYQIDVYPSILGLIGCKNPKWKGVGMNLLDTVPRRVDFEQANRISDKLIRSRYFSTH